MIGDQEAGFAVLGSRSPTHSYRTQLAGYGEAGRRACSPLRALRPRSHIARQERLEGGERMFRGVERTFRGFFKNLWEILQEPLGDSQEHLGDSSRTSRGFFENLQTFFKNLGGILQEPLGDSSRTLKHSSRTSGRFFKNVWQILDQPWKLLIG